MINWCVKKDDPEVDKLTPNLVAQLSCISHSLMVQNL
jgi:hypothetical protein